MYFYGGVPVDYGAAMRICKCNFEKVNFIVERLENECLLKVPTVFLKLNNSEGNKLTQNAIAACSEARLLQKPWKRSYWVQICLRQDSKPKIN